ncbi:Gfo/Idh/MocA family protein [Glaciimonas sp. GG7]
MRIFKGALIGCGFFAQNHLHAWRDLDGVEIVALCDADTERLHSSGKLFGITRLYTDAATMLAQEQLDFVDIATTVGSHRILVEMAAKAGVNVICQKPFAENLADARAMTEYCAAAGVALMVHENFRWQTPILALRAALEQGAIGQPFWGRISFRSAYDVYRGQPYLATDARFIIQDLGIHLLDIARCLFGDVAQLSATTRRVNPNIVGEDVATMLSTHRNGVTSIVDCSYATLLAEDPFPQVLVEIDGSEGSLRLLSGYRLQIHNALGTQTIDCQPPLLPWAERPWHNIQGSVSNIQQHWLDCLRNNQAPATSGRDNLQTLAMVEAAYHSAAHQQLSVAIAD